MKKTIFGLFVLSAILFSCKKDTGGDTNNPATSYMSLTAGQTRTYETTDNIAMSTSSNTTTSTNRDTSVNSRTYHVFTNSDGSSDYFNVTGSDYYSFTQLPALSNLQLELLYLKSNAAVNASWNQTTNVTVPGVPFPLAVTISNTIMEKGISRTTGTMSHTDVIRVQTGISVAGLPASALTTNIQSYYAPRYGLVESTAVLGLNYSGITDSVNTRTLLKAANF
ncbi:MAG: hypothetical protein WAT19_16950 [Ferruginibacter sp.]